MNTSFFYDENMKLNKVTEQYKREEELIHHINILEHKIEKDPTEIILLRMYRNLFDQLLTSKYYSKV